MPAASPTARRRDAWSRAHAERLLWRSGFGGRPAEIEFWARRGRAATVGWLLHGGVGPHGHAAMVGPEPRVDGKPLDPVNEWGHDGLWWLDRMVRSQRPLQERMTLFWHDHFATSDQDTPLMLAQNRTLRAGALGSFPRLLRAVTVDPAMQSFLSLADSDKGDPNENFARELMELFTLGAGAGYSERDVRQAARALTGFVSTKSPAGLMGVRYDAAAHDAGLKVVLGRRGRLGWREALDACVAHPAHAPFLVDKLWSFFITEPLPAVTRRRLAAVYRRSGHRLGPLLAALLHHPALYADLQAPAMVKAPAVLVAGHLRLLGRGIDIDAWSWLSGEMGQQLFAPPSVAGWDWGPAWMSTSTMRARFLVATYLTKDPPLRVDEHAGQPGWSAAEHVEQARRATGRPWTSRATDRELRSLAQGLLAQDRRPGDKQQPWRAAIAQNALRHLLLSGPDAQLC